MKPLYTAIATVDVPDDFDKAKLREAVVNAGFEAEFPGETRTDIAPDSGTVDMGFHYSLPAPTFDDPLSTSVRAAEGATAVGLSLTGVPAGVTAVRPAVGGRRPGSAGAAGAAIAGDKRRPPWSASLA